MIGAIYIEDEVARHPRVEAICRRFPRVPKIAIRRYGEVFNRGGQSFRLQKRRPSLILAHKAGQRVLATPEGYGIGGRRNFYFSHMLNCLYDCRYCFLQGMYRSAHYVLFVNYEDFFDEIEQTSLAGAEESWFFSGYDCDSLAFEGVSGFVAAALPALRRIPGAHLELRTKSLHLKPLWESEPWSRCVVAFSLTPEAISQALEHKVPALSRRLAALGELHRRGWPVGLRFDPLIYCQDFQSQYRRLFRQVFEHLPGDSVHSVSFGPFRLPTGFFRRLEKQYPDEPLVAGPLAKQQGMVSYPRQLEAEMVEFVNAELSRYVPAEAFFPCTLPDVVPQAEGEVVRGAGV